MKTAFNETTGVTEVFLPAKLVRISNNKLTNSNQTEYQIATVAVTYPDGTVKESESIIYSKQIASLPEVFCAGSEVEIAVQIEGNYAGNSRVSLPKARKIDLTMLGLETPQQTPAITA